MSTRNVIMEVGGWVGAMKMIGGKIKLGMSNWSPLQVFLAVVLVFIIGFVVGSVF